MWNCYPHSFINHSIANCKCSCQSQHGEQKPTATICFPYITGVSHTLKRVLADRSIRVILKLCYSEVIRVILKPCNLLVKPKNPVPLLKRSDVVYQVRCSDCPISYIGETKRHLKIRIEEHKRAVSIASLRHQHWPSMHGQWTIR